MVFCKGARVEVCSKEPGYVGSYYRAIVLEINKHNNKMDDTEANIISYEVVYNNLVTEDKSKRLVETVRYDEVRPVPPKHRIRGEFCVGDEVDVFDNDGWWVGRITRKDGSKCYVYFATTGELLEYDVSLLRVHQNWIKGKWIVSTKRFSSLLEKQQKTAVRKTNKRKRDCSLAEEDEVGTSTKKGEGFLIAKYDKALSSNLIVLESW